MIVRKAVVEQCQDSTCTQKNAEWRINCCGGTKQLRGVVGTLRKEGNGTRMFGQKQSLVLPINGSRDSLQMPTALGRVWVSHGGRKWSESAKRRLQPSAEYQCLCKKLLSFLSMPNRIHKAPLASMVVMTEEYQQGWCRAREFTSASPSGYHFGHVKVAGTNQYLADIEATLTNITYASGYSPQRWHQGTNCVIEKKPGNWRVDKL